MVFRLLALTKIGHASGMEAVGYLLDKVACDAHDYYAGEGLDGRWCGADTGAFELQGSVTRSDFEALIEGRSPLDGTDLQGVRRGPKRKVLGWDLTFSAPKSASVVWATGDPALRKAVEESHDRAVLTALNWMERHALFSRRGAGGSEVVGCNGVIAARFQHRTSRAGDPQLHTHVAVMNLVRSIDGQWRTLFGAQLFTHAKACGFVYQAALRKELGALQLLFRPAVNGMADIVGVPEIAIRSWSKRRQQILAGTTRLGYDTARARQVVAYATRSAKPDEAESDHEALFDRWQKEFASLDCGEAAFQQSATDQPPAPGPLGRDAASFVASADSGVAESSGDADEGSVRRAFESLVASGLRLRNGRVVVVKILRVAG